MGLEVKADQSVERIHGYSVYKINLPGGQEKGTIRAWPRILYSRINGPQFGRDMKFTLNDEDGGTDPQEFPRLKEVVGVAPNTQTNETQIESHSFSLPQIVNKHWQIALKEAVNDFQDSGKCKLPVMVYYKVVEEVVSHVRYGGRVRVTNILDHMEWKDKEFTTDYLPAEKKMIESGKLSIERFFVGTLDNFENEEVRRLLMRNSQAGVRVRRVYVDKNMSQQRGFQRDIGIYETPLQTFIEGETRKGYIIHGYVATDNETEGAFYGIIEKMDKYSPAYNPSKQRSQDPIAIRARSSAGWQQTYFPQNVPAWQEAPCPMLTKPGNVGETTARLEDLILRSIKIRELDTSGSDIEKDRTIRIVDAGCGDGRNLLNVAQVCCGIAVKSPSVKFELLGVDVCEFAIFKCRSSLRKYLDPRPDGSDQLTWRAVARDIVEEIPAVTNTVDILLCIDTFGQLHPSDVPSALKEWARVLRQSGFLLFNAYTPEDDTLKDCQTEAASGNKEISKQDLAYHNAWLYKDTYYKYYDEFEIAQLLKKAGYTILMQNADEWEDPPHAPYRPNTHIHRNWIILALPPP